jgi:hypothetical protein
MICIIMGPELVVALFFVKQGGARGLEKSIGLSGFAFDSAG